MIHLLVAALIGEVDLVSFFLEIGNNKDAKDKNSQSALEHIEDDEIYEILTRNQEISQEL